MAKNYPEINEKLKTPLSNSGASSSDDMDLSSGDADQYAETPKLLFGMQRDRLGLVMCILICELCERLTYYSVAGNLVLYCTNELDYSSADATTVAFIFTGTSYIVPVAGGWIADTISGKFNAIYGAALIYCLGTSLLPFISIDYVDIGEGLGLTDGQKRGFFLFSLAMIAVGTGGIKSNVGPFGAQQLDDLGEGHVKSFFNWFYWFINVGSAVAFSLVAYLQQEVGFDVGFAIPAVSIVVAICVFQLGRKRYNMRPPEGSVFTTVAKILWQALSRLRTPDMSGMKISSFLDRAKFSFGGSFDDIKVDEVKSLGRIIPIFLTVIFYWTVYFQMSTTYLLQGECMQLSVGDLTIPVAALNLFNIAIILVMVPFVDRFFYPFMERRGLPLTKLKRIGIGMILAVVSMVIASGVEFARKSYIEMYGTFVQYVGDKPYDASYLSVFAQAAQYLFIGASEVFASITGLEFAYSQSPVAMQGVVMGLFLLTSGLGSYLGSLLVTIVNAITAPHQWIPNDINKGSLEYFFLLLAGIMLVDFFCFLIIAKRYRYIDQSQLELPADPVVAKAEDQLEKDKLHNGKTYQTAPLLVSDAEA